jgi:hypothetical protein
MITTIGLILAWLLVLIGIGMVLVAPFLSRRTIYRMRRWRDWNLYRQEGVSEK